MMKSYLNRYYHCSANITSILICHILILLFENMDEFLTSSLQEIMENYDLFVGSQATDFGEALTRHDEF